MSKRLLVVEDNDYLRNYMQKVLSRAGYEVSEANSGKAAVEALRDLNFDAVLLDLDLGDMNGVEVIALLRRQHYEIPIIVISNFEEIDTKVNAFNVGCDDYLTKPFYKEELLARLKRLQQRSHMENKPSPQNFQDREVFGPFQIDYGSCLVTKAGVPLELNKKLFGLLAYFIKHQDTVISKEQLLERFWKEQDEPSLNSLSVHIHMLRQQIEDDAKKPQYLITKRGLGYLLHLPDSAPPD